MAAARGTQIKKQISFFIVRYFFLPAAGAG